MLAILETSPLLSEAVTHPIPAAEGLTYSSIFPNLQNQSGALDTIFWGWPCSDGSDRLCERCDLVTAGATEFNHPSTGSKLFLKTSSTRRSVLVVKELSRIELLALL